MRLGNVGERMSDNRDTMGTAPAAAQSSSLRCTLAIVPPPEAHSFNCHSADASFVSASFALDEDLRAKFTGTMIVDVTNDDKILYCTYNKM